MDDAEGRAAPVARGSDTVRADDTAATELSQQAAEAISAHGDRCVREARRSALFGLLGVAIAVAGGRSRLPLWIVVAAGAVAAYEFRVMAARLNAARHDADSLVRQPLRAWTLPVSRLRRRGGAEHWLLLYATGAAAPPAPFAAVSCTADVPVPTAALLVDVAGVPKRGRVLTVFDAATGRLLGMGRVAGTARTVDLMRPG